jgi:hypothetical protein
VFISRQGYVFCYVQPGGVWSCTRWFKALIMPMRANIVGPPSVATRITYSASHPSASAAARNVRQARISPASDARAWLRACLATCQCGLFRSESLMYIMKE